MKKKIALIGLGYTSQITHLKCILYSKNCELTTIYDERVLLKKKIQKKYNIKNCLNKITDLKNLKKDVDIVVLCVERYKQQNFLETISKFGFSVLTEKPFCINSDISKKISKEFKKNNKNCLVSFMKVHDSACLKFKNFLKKNITNEGYFIGKLFGGDLRNNAFWRIKSNEKSIKENELDLVNKKILSKNRLSYLIFLNRFQHSINLVLFLFDIEIKKMKNISISKINKFSFNLMFNYKNIYFNLNFGDSKQASWLEEYTLITKEETLNLKMNSPFNVQNCGEFRIEKNENTKIYNSNNLKYKWSFQSQLEYFLKNYKKPDILNNITDCVEQQLLLEKIWSKLK